MAARVSGWARLPPSSRRSIAPAATAEPCHAQMYVMGTILKHGSAEQKAAYLPKVASGELRLQAFAVTEPGAGTDTTRISTFARREGDRYIVSGQKIWISRAEHSDLMVLLCRTASRSAAKRPGDGMSVLIVDMREALANGLTVRPIRTMLNHATTELFFNDLPVPVDNLIGEEGRGFSYILDGMNAERILIDCGVRRRRSLLYRSGQHLRQWPGGSSAARSARTRASNFPLRGPLCRLLRPG